MLLWGFSKLLADPLFLKLLAVMVAAAAMGPENEKYVPRIQNRLDRDNQAEIMQIIRSMQQDIANFKDDDDLDEALDAVMEARDIDLVVEEQNAALRHQLDSTKKNLSDYITRLEYLQQSHEELKYDKEKNDRELDVLRKATQDGANSAEAIKLLEAQVHEQMDIIARNEEAIRNHDRTKAHLESEVQRLSQKSMQADELRDQVTEWKHKAEEFEKKANTAERYKQKLEAQQGLAKEVQNLQYERADLQEQLRSLINDRERSERTRKAEDELTKMITQSEQHLWDERNQKNQLLKDMTTIEEELARLKAQRAHDERFIQDLHEQLQQGGGSAPQGDALGLLPASSTLEDELNNAASEDGPPNLPLELSRLKAENELLRRTLGSNGDTALLRREMEEQKRQRDRTQQNFNEIFEKHTILQEQLSALMSNETSERFVSKHTRAVCYLFRGGSCSHHGGAAPKPSSTCEDSSCKRSLVSRKQPSAPQICRPSSRTWTESSSAPRASFRLRGRTESKRSTSSRAPTTSSLNLSRLSSIDYERTVVWLWANEMLRRRS